MEVKALLSLLSETAMGQCTFIQINFFTEMSLASATFRKTSH